MQSDCGILTLDGEVIACIIRILAQLPRTQGFVMQRNARDSAMNVYALIASCRAIYEIYRTLCPKELADKRASLCFCVTPTTFADETEPHPFALQQLKEQRTEQHYRVLRDAMRNMALHCAGACCRRQRSMVRKAGAAGGKPMVSPISESALVMNAAAGAGVVYVHSRVRKSKRSRDASHSSARSADVLRRHELISLREQMQTGRAGCSSPRSPNRDVPYGAHTHTLSIDTTSNSAPLFLASSPCGEAVAYIVAVHSNDMLDQEPLSKLFVWFPLIDEHVHIPANEVHDFDTQEIFDRTGCTVADTAGTPFGLLHPQHVCWRPSAHGRMRLVATWSTTFTTPSGHCDEHETVVKKYERYAIAHYDIEAGGGESSMEAEGPFFGRRLMTFQLDARGDRAVALVRQHLQSPRDVRQLASLHRLDTGRLVDLVHPTVWKPRMSAQGMNWGPSAVGISPMGDVVICVHRTRGSILVEVRELLQDEIYESILVKDVTNWLALGQPPDAISYFEMTPIDYNDNYVKLPYAITFSTCGRFVTVHDQRPFFGLSQENHAFVIFDLSKRRTSIRACPMGSMEDTSPRMVQWTHDGIYTLTRHGAALLRVD